MFASVGQAVSPTSAAGGRILQVPLQSVPLLGRSSMSETPNKIVAGVLAAERIVAGLVADGHMADGVQHFPPPEDSDAALTSMPADAVVAVICEQIRTLCHARKIEVA